MKSFIGKDFLITNKTGLMLYEKYAKSLPIYDYHCHLSPKDIAEDKVFFDVCELMLAHDHYKWRIMRMAGVDEKYITGDACYKEKFTAYAKALSLAIGNPLHHWTHMELKEYFGIDEPLNEKSAEKIYKLANEKMAGGDFSARKLIEKSNVYLIATTDDPADDLKYHSEIKNVKNFETIVVPTFRPDLVCNIAREDYRDYIKKLGKTAGKDINDLMDLKETLINRIVFFEKMGCRIADHGVNSIPDVSCREEEASDIFQRAISGEQIFQKEADKFLIYMLVFFAVEYAKRDWCMQIHMSPLRNQNAKLFTRLGPDCGADSVGDAVSASALGRFFNTVESMYTLPKTILYSLNPSAYYILSTMAGNFSAGVPGKIQLGAAWWFCDHRDGILEQLKIFANTGVLGVFNGMLTDSRSFTSYVRHDYFRRILCSLIGEWIEEGEYPMDEDAAATIIKGICFYNAKNYFDMQR